MDQTGPWSGQDITIDRGWCADQLRVFIEATEGKRAREDVRYFLKPPDLPSLDLWCREFFLAQAAKLL